MEILLQACQFYVASFWLLPISFDVLMPQASLNPAQMQPVLKHIAHATGAEVVFKSNCFEMHGLEQEVRAAVMMVLELEVIAVSLLFHFSHLLGHDRGLTLRDNRASTTRSDSRLNSRMNIEISFLERRTAKSTRS